MSIGYNSWIKNLRTNIGSAKYPDLAVRWQPDSLDLPEQIGYFATTHIVGLTELAFLQRTALHGLNVQNQLELVEIDLPYFANASANLLLKTNSHLTTITAPNISLPLYGTSLTGASLDFSANALSATTVDNLFNRLALSLSTGHAYFTKIDTSGGTNAAPTAASSLARSSLFLGATAYHIAVATN